MYKILSLSGGGIKGFITLELLKHIEAESGKRMADMFDLIVGTSSGALIGALLDNYDADKISHILRYEATPNLFKPNFFSFNGLIQSKYNTQYKEYYIDYLFRNKCKTTNFDYAATSYDICNNRCVVFNTLEEEFTSNYHLKKNFELKNAVLASTAAPLYWNPHKELGSIYIDGAFCANDPTSIGIKLALNKQISLNDIAIVSIGTGLTRRTYKLKQGNNPIKWIVPLFNSMMNGQVNMTNMLYENELLTYFNLNPSLINSNDDIDCTTNENFEAMIKDCNRFLETKPQIIKNIVEKFS
jgi:uncharacterized protein